MDGVKKTEVLTDATCMPAEGKFGFGGHSTEDTVGVTKFRYFESKPSADSGLN